MKREHQPVDELFREKLKDHQITPSDEARKRFLSEASAIRRKRGGIRYTGMLLLAMMIFLGTVVIFTFHHLNEQTVPSVASVEAVAPADNSSPSTAPHPPDLSTGISSSASSSASLSTSPHTSTSNSLPSSSGSSSTGSPLSGSYPSGSPASGASSGFSSASSSASSVILSSSTSNPASSSTSSPDPENTDSNAATRTSASGSSSVPQIIDHMLSFRPTSLTSEKSQVILLNNISRIPDTTVIIQPDTSLKTNLLSSETSPRKKNPQAHRWNPAISVGYVPEWMLNTLEGTKYVNTFLIEGSLKKDRYLLRAGAGISWTEGTNELLVEYNDYLGSYTHLDSMSFNWDAKHYHLLPTYYTSDQAVWDSLLKSDYPTVRKRYTYLQIPVIFGYDFIRKKRFSVGLRAGQILSILIGEKQLTPDYDPMKNKVIQINNVTVDRIESNWQILAGVNASWHISPRFTLELEPLVRYYFTSVYEQADISKKVWSVGFRTAITFGK